VVPTCRVPFLAHRYLISRDVIWPLGGWGTWVSLVSHDVWFLKQVIEGAGRDDDDTDGDVDGEGYRGALNMVTKKGELKRWEKGLDIWIR